MVTYSEMWWNTVNCGDLYIYIAIYGEIQWNMVKYGELYNHQPVMWILEFTIWTHIYLVGGFNASNVEYHIWYSW